MISYAQNFEDVILNRIFKGKKNGFYIDIGAWHPIDHSVTKYFYDEGWSGINVEPSELYFKLLEKHRIRDINVNCIISDNSNEIEYLEIPRSGASTALKAGWDIVKEQGTLAKDANCKNIHSTTLANICRQYANTREIDFLKIDVEGLEALVIKGGDWKHFRPVIVLVEAVAPFSNIQNHSEWEEFLLNEGYIFVYFDGLNRFYVRKESEELSRFLTLPPNVFDEFQLYDGFGKRFYRSVSIGKFKLTICF